MVALGCFAPLFFIGLLFFGISTVVVSPQSAPAVAVTPVVVTEVAPTPTAKSYQSELHPDVVAKIITGEGTIVELVK
jgi:hypothetical protein